MINVRGNNVRGELIVMFYNQHDYCSDTNMVRYLDDKNLSSAIRPGDSWCNMFMNACAAREEALIAGLTEATKGSDERKLLA